MLGHSALSHESFDFRQGGMHGWPRLSMKPPAFAVGLAVVLFPLRLHMLAHILEGQFVERGVRLRHARAEIDDPHAARPAGDVLAVDPRPHDVGVGSTVRVESVPASIWAATSALMSNAPPFVSPMKDRPAFSGSRRATVRSSAAVRFAFILAATCPSSSRVVSAPPSNPTIETRTAAPSRIHGRSLHAQKMSPVSLIRSSTLRFAPPRMAWVANSPARFAFPAAICARARSNQ